MLGSRRTTALHVGPVLLGVAAFYAYYVVGRIQQYGVLWFVHLGEQFLRTSTSSSVLTPSLGWQSPVGYDGQYYYAVAVDPAHAHSYIGGNAGIVYSRVLYPVLARAAGGGTVSGVEYGMLAVNLAAVAVGTAAVALWLRGRDLPAWPAAVYALYPGLVFTVFRDLTEPLAFALVACAVLAFDERRTRRLVLAAALFALAALARETVLPFPLAAAAALVAGDRRGRGLRTWAAWSRGVLFALGSIVPLFVWRAVVTLALHEPTQESGHGREWAVPFNGIFSYWPFDDQHWLILLTIVLPAVAFLVAAAVLLRRRREVVAAALLAANALLFVVFLPEGVDVDYNAASRASIGVVLSAMYCLPAWWRPRVRVAAAAGALSWSIAWYLLIAWALGLKGIHLITQ